jgi:hypothetical protein
MKPARAAGFSCVHIAPEALDSDEAACSMQLSQEARKEEEADVRTAFRTFRGILFILFTRPGV